MTDEDGLMERVVRMDIINTDMVRMWEYLEDLDELMRVKEDIKCLEEMQESAQSSMQMQIELGTTIADDFIKLNVEAELMLQQMMGKEDYKFEGSEEADRLI